MKRSVGMRRLDELTGGGIDDRAFTFIHGPPFAGKEMLAQRFLLAGLAQGLPAISILATESPTEARAKLTRLDPRFPQHEKEGLVRFIDAYTPQIAPDAEAEPNVLRVDSLTNFNGLMRAAEQAWGDIAGDADSHRIVLDSISILTLNTNLQTTFRFLQVFIGKAKRAGGSGILLADEGMHSRADIQTFKTLVNGAIEVKRENEKNFLHIEGLDLTTNPGWIEYAFSQSEMDLTGSFAAGRIR